MQNILPVERIECLDHLNEDFPDERLVHLAVRLLILDNFLIEIAIVEELHHDAQAGSLILKKGLFVTDNALVTIDKNDEVSNYILNIRHSYPKIEWSSAVYTRLYLLEGGENSNFIQGVFFFFDAQLAHFDLER